jgi:hypothetical protein
MLKVGVQNISNPAPGIHTHLVGDDGTVFGGKIFPAQEELLLL